MNDAQFCFETIFYGAWHPRKASNHGRHFWIGCTPLSIRRGADLMRPQYGYTV